MVDKVREELLALIQKAKDICANDYSDHTENEYIADMILDTGMVNEWIPVTERLPDLVPCAGGRAYSEAVNVLTTGGKVMTAVWDGIDFICPMDYWCAWGEEITHWTPVLSPLPDAPKDGE